MILNRARKKGTVIISVVLENQGKSNDVDLGWETGPAGAHSYLNIKTRLDVAAWSSKHDQILPDFARPYVSWSLKHDMPAYMMLVDSSESRQEGRAREVVAGRRS